MKFKYISSISVNPLTKEKDIIYRPFVPVDIGYQGRWLSSVTEGAIKYVDALIDSGSDYNLGPMKIASIIKIPLEGVSPHKIYGIEGGGIDTYFVPVSLNIGGRIYDTFMGFAQSISEILLGGRGFFDKWKVKLEYAKDVELKMGS